MSISRPREIDESDERKAGKSRATGGEKDVPVVLELLSGEGKRVGDFFLAVLKQRPFMGHMAVVDKGHGEFVHMPVAKRAHARAIGIGQGNGVFIHRTGGSHAWLVAQQAIMCHDHFVPVLCIDRDHFFRRVREDSFDDRRAVCR